MNKKEKDPWTVEKVPSLLPWGFLPCQWPHAARDGDSLLFSSSEAGLAVPTFS